MAGLARHLWPNLPLGLLGGLATRRHPPGAPRAAAAHLAAPVSLCSGGRPHVLIRGQAPAGRRACPAAVTRAGGRLARHQRRRRARAPRARADAAFRRINAIGLLINFDVFGALFLMTLYIQQARQASPLATGLNLLPLMVMYTLGNLITARLMPRYGIAVPLRAGLTLAALGTAAAAAVAVVDGCIPVAARHLLAIANLGAAIAPRGDQQRARPGRQAARTRSRVLNANRQIRRAGRRGGRGWRCMGRSLGASCRPASPC
jgi:DHA2 family methylenomycin A resistance protein-like MFS transporter